MQAFYLVVFLLTLLNCDKVTQSDSKMNGFTPESQQFAGEHSFYYWADDKDVFRAKCREKQVVNIENCTDGKNIQSQKRELFDTKLKKLLGYYLPKQNSELVATYKKTIADYRKQLQNDSPELKEKRQTLIAETEKKLAEVYPKSAEGAYEAFAQAVYTPKDLLISGQSALAPKYEFANSILEGAFTYSSPEAEIKKIQLKIRTLKEKGHNVSCRLKPITYRERIYTRKDDVFGEEIGPNLNGSNITLIVASPKALSEPDASEFCKNAELKIPSSYELNDSGALGIYDYNDSNRNRGSIAEFKCKNLANSKIFKDLETFSSTGSSIVPNGKIIWLPHPKKYHYVGEGYPRENADQVSLALFAAVDGTCHVNAPAYTRVDPSWKLSTLCASDTYFIPALESKDKLDALDCSKF